MAFAKVHSAQTNLLSGGIIDVEIDLSRGLHSFSIVGLPDKATEEARDRIAAAIKNSGFTSPKQRNQKIVIALAPAEIKKEGSGFDVAMAVGYLLGTEDIEGDVSQTVFMGELSLDGKLRPVRGAIALTKIAHDNGFKEIIVPFENRVEAALISGIDVIPVRTLADVITHIQGEKILPQQKTQIEEKEIDEDITFDDIVGQESAKRALTIAAAGKHNIGLYGPPGTGKTMLAKAFRSVLPKLSHDEILEITSIHSIAGTLKEPYITDPPFRSPHHTSSYVALVGGGATPRPGEITLAHRGVLFLDEFAEFETRVLEALREPLEEKKISVSRAKATAVFPAHFILVAALNPCPCGNRGFKGPACICSPVQLLKYERKISGPILDRIDMWISVGRIEHEKLLSEKNSRENSRIKETIKSARGIQQKRYSKIENTKVNGDLSVKDLINYIKVSDNVKETLNDAARTLNLSPRGYHKVIKLARTIADLEKSEEIKKENLLEALSYRPPKNTLA
ncbi:MAG: YifB family Mg chelatase-like AAA ATPase [Minisyncoccia bacterium]